MERLFQYFIDMGNDPASHAVAVLIFLKYRKVYPLGTPIVLVYVGASCLMLKALLCLLLIVVLSRYDVLQKIPLAILFLPPFLWAELFGFLLVMQRVIAVTPRLKKDMAFYAMIPVPFLYHCFMKIAERF